MKLNQLIPVVDGVKSRSKSEITNLHHICTSNAGLFDGFTRTYKPLNDDATAADQLPDESKKVQQSVDAILKQYATALTNLSNTVCSQDATNQKASASITVDGVIIAENVPVTHLIFLEKQLKDTEVFISKLPELNPAEEWEYDSNSGCHRTKKKETFKTKKEYRNHVKAEATEKHPAQVEVYTQDVPIGIWTAIGFSGSIPFDEKKALLKKVYQLQDAIKAARESANSIQIENSNVGTKIVEFLFSK